MSDIDSLNVYGHVLNAELVEGSLDSSHLSREPQLSFAEAPQLQDRIEADAFISFVTPPALASAELQALYGQYETALLEIAQAAEPDSLYTRDNYLSHFAGSDSKPKSTQDQYLSLGFWQTAKFGTDAKRYQLFDTSGGFDGDLTLIGPDGSNLSHLVEAILAEPGIFENPDATIDIINILLHAKPPSGSSLLLDFNRDGKSDLGLSLDYEITGHADLGQDEAFQLDLISEGKRITVPGKEETAEGWLNLDQNRVVLLGDNLSLKQDDLVKFGWDQALPDNLDYQQTYSIDEPQTIEGGVSFKLRKVNTDEAINFGSSDGAAETDFPFGIRLALAEQEKKLVIGGFDAFESFWRRSIPLDGLVLNDLRVQTRDPHAAKEASWSSWTDLPLASAEAAFSDLRLSLDQNSDLPSIPADWDVRLSYDDLLQETISAAALESGVYLQFDQALIVQILEALADKSVNAANLNIGPAETDDFLSFNLSDYLSNTSTQNPSPLYTAIGSANWALAIVDSEAAILKLQPETQGEDLSNFQVHLSLVHEEGGAPEPVYNVAQLVRDDGAGNWIPVDPDGFSLWKEWSGGPVAIDRYGDQLNRLGNQAPGAEPPTWSDYNPWVSINSDWRRPWDEQQTAPKTLEIEGNSFDGGDDLIIHFSLELPDDPLTPAWEGEWRDYVLLFDLYSEALAWDTFERQGFIRDADAIFQEELDVNVDSLSYDPYFTKRVWIGEYDILSGEEPPSLTANELLDAVASGLEDFLSNEAAELREFFATPGFTLSEPTLDASDGRSVLKATLDFPAPEGEGDSRPSVTLWARMIEDPSNGEAYDAAWQAYSAFTLNEEQEWLYNYGSIQPQFQSAWTNPLEDDEPSTRTITLDYRGLEPLADAYTRGDLLLNLNNKRVDPAQYTVKNLWGYQLQIILNSDSGLTLSADSELSVSLSDNHNFLDTRGNRLATTTLAVDNWAAWQSYGYDLNEQLFLDHDNSYVDDKTIRLSFLGSADLSLDAGKAIVPQTSDFQFWGYDFNTGETTELELDETKPLKVDAKALVFTLANPIGSDLSIDVTYDPFLDSSNTDAFTNTNGVQAEAFYWQPLDNRSPDKQGPSISWSGVSGNQLSLGLTDPAGVWVGDQELKSSNLPAPSDFLIKASKTNGTSRTLTATSIYLSPWGVNELELQLDASVQPDEMVSLSYQGSQLKDGKGNLSALRQIPVNNYSLGFDDNNVGSWFQDNDRITVVFKEAGAGGFYLMENGSVSSSPENLQIQDDYNFSLSTLSLISIDLTDRAGGTLDDEGDANLDFSLENLRTGDFIGGSWNSLNESWWLEDGATNDERDVEFVLPAGDYRLSVMHVDFWQESMQTYQLEITHSPSFNLTTTQLETSENELISSATVPLGDEANTAGSARKIFLDLQDAGQITAKLTSSSNDSWLDLYDLNGMWIGSSYGQPLSQYVLPGLYQLELGSWSELPSDVALDLQLDSSIKLAVDTDSREAPSGSISVNGLPAKGDLNPLDRDDFWTIKLNGGKIYTLRASGFIDDVNLTVEDDKGFWVADSWNWGTYADDGTFNPSDETIVLDLSSKQTGTYTYTIRTQTWGNTPTGYSLLAKSHATLAEAQTEAARGIISYDSLFDDYFGADSGLADAADFDQSDLQELAALEEVNSETLRQIKAKLDKLGLSPSGNVLAINTTLGNAEESSSKEPEPILISRKTPDSVPNEIADKIRESAPGLLSEQHSQLLFGPEQVAELVRSTSNTATSIKPVSKPLGIKVEEEDDQLGGYTAQDWGSNQLSEPGLINDPKIPDLGLQRVSIPLDDDTRAALDAAAKDNKTLVWYKTPAQGDAWIFTYDSSTGTGARLEDTDSSKDGADVMALYIQDGGRGDDDRRVNGEIVSPGGLALAQLVAVDPLADWNADIDGDGLFSPLSDGLALAWRFSNPNGNDDEVIGSFATPGSPRSSAADMLARIDAGFNAGRFDLDGNGSTDSTDLSLAMRHGFGTFPGDALAAGLNLPESFSLGALSDQLQLLMPSNDYLVNFV